MPSRFLPLLPGRSPPRDEARGRGPPDPHRNTADLDVESGHRPRGRGARRPVEADVVVLSRWGEGVRGLRLLPAPAQGIQGGGREGPAPLRAAGTDLITPPWTLHTPPWRPMWSPEKPPARRSSSASATR